MTLANKVIKHFHYIFCCGIFQEQFGTADFSDMAFYRDAVLLCSVNSSTYLLNLTNLEVTEVMATAGVSALAVDTVTARLYWANPRIHMVREARQQQDIIVC